MLDTVKIQGQIMSAASRCCAIYTRKSCEDGLEQEFNSLDAQRLSAENYIVRQIHENWRLISKHYDDGGYSGDKSTCVERIVRRY